MLRDSIAQNRSVRLGRYIQERPSMYFLYASKAGKTRKLAATFDSEQQLRAYVGWATLQQNPDGTSKFEQGSIWPVTSSGKLPPSL